MSNDNVDAEYTYAPSGLRLTKTVDNEQIYYINDGDNVIAELYEDEVTAYYLRGRNLFGSFIGNDEYFYLYNAHGDVVNLTDTSGYIEHTYRYDAFGNEREPESSDNNPFRYCGEYYDGETGSYYLRARYYDPVVGRFAQQDSYRGDIAQPLSLNYYAYCYNNPVQHVDRSGNVPVDTIFDIVSLSYSTTNLLLNPSKETAFNFLWDLGATFIPYVPGSYADDVVKGAARLTKAVPYQSVWDLKPFDRGWTIEAMLGGNCNNFPIIDRFNIVSQNASNTIINDLVSIKSIDLNATSYQKAGTLRRTLKNYVTALEDFTIANYVGIQYKAAKDATRTLQIAIPEGAMTKTQADVFAEIVQMAKEKSINVIITPIK